VLARIRKAQEENESGFTLIELLVVMIIIGILAAIAIPVFLSQRAKAQDSAAKADVSTVGKELATYYVDNTVKPTLDTTTHPGRYSLEVAAAAGPPAVAAIDQDLGKVSTNVVLTDTSAKIVDNNNWCVAVVNSKGDKKNWKYSSSNGLESGTC
jgi:prepilin-type N-terminal cleavage/methylation domain-containing protein